MGCKIYYNENDPKIVQWLLELIKQGCLPDGDVDDRSIEDIRPNEIKSYNQCHFFAGIGGWALALQLANWGNWPVWTGSCPCQPFSSAGKGSGFADERHLWPSWFHLIKECRPSVVFSEQVEAAIIHGWLDLVQDDLEGENYAFGSVGLPAASVGAPHQRHRIFWVGHAQSSTRRLPVRLGRSYKEESQPCRASKISKLGNNNNTRLEGRRLSGIRCTDQQSAWSPSDFIWCRDGKYRPVEPGTFPLAHGVPARVGRLRGYGNAIVPQVAATFVRAYLDSVQGVVRGSRG